MLGVEKARMRGGVSGGGAGSFSGGPDTRKTRKTLRNCIASLLRSNIQDFVQEVPVGQNGSGYPLSVPAVAHPPPNFQNLGGVKPPECPTRRPDCCRSQRRLHGAVVQDATPKPSVC